MVGLASETLWWSVSLFEVKATYVRCLQCFHRTKSKRSRANLGAITRKLFDGRFGARNSSLKFYQVFKMHPVFCNTLNTQFPIRIRAKSLERCGELNNVLDSNCIPLPFTSPVIAQRIPKEEFSSDVTTNKLIKRCWKELPFSSCSILLRKTISCTLIRIQ